MKKLALMVIALSLLVVGMATAMSMCPFDPGELPSGINFGYITADMNTAGTVNGVVGYNSFMSYATTGEISSDTEEAQLLHGRGPIQFAAVNSLTPDVIMGQLAAGIGSGTLLISDANYANSCTNTSVFDANNSSVVPYCEKMMSSSRAVLSTGQFASQSTLVPINPSGSISQVIGVEGSGSVYGESSLMSYQKGNTSQLMQMNDRVKFVGTDIVFGRDITLSSKR